jgi:hypothetical protein
MRPSRIYRIMIATTILTLAVGVADAQLIVEDFDGYATGSPPPSPWWNWGTSGTNLIDDTVFRGASGKSVGFTRLYFDGNPFAIGQSFTPIHGTAELSYFFLATNGEREVLSVFGRNSSNNAVGWWVTVGGVFGDAVATYSNSQGWTHVMNISTGAWYGVRLVIDMAAQTYDITVWQDADPTNTATVTGIAFRDGASASDIDEIQAGDFHAGFIGITGLAYLDDLRLIGETVFTDDFEIGDLSAWSAVEP